MVRDSGEGCDDGNVVSRDGWNELCSVESGYSCTGGSPTSIDTWKEICGDGKRFNTISTYWDDNNTSNGDGWSSTWGIETGWTWSGGSKTTKDVCNEICGDGIKFNSISTYWDDGNNVNSDGWNSVWGVEVGYIWSGGSSSSKDTCSEKWGDGIRFNSISTYCDDGNSVNGDGWSSGWAIEFGFNWSGGSTTTKDTCTEVCGDGKRFNSLSTFWDDGNNINGDGWNSVWGVEVGYAWSGGSTTSKDTCSEIWGDGIRINSLSTYWDDGNIVNGDGCSSGCAIESGWLCSGGSTTTKDTCTEICGDGKRFNSIVTYCDDGNTSSNDGCSSTWAIESGWSWSGGTTTSADSWIDICGDGKVVKPATNYWDDGNLVNGDGCNGSWAVETGWSWPGGSISSPSVCSEIWGDGITIIHNALKWDDGNTVNGDGCSNTCFVETGWGWTGGSSTKTDVWTIICGDGIYMSQAEQCDDGNILSGDGWSQLCKLESGYSWSTNVSNNPATTWQETWGDGRRFGPTGWDDGNTVSGDGWSSTWTVEPGYSWQGGSSVSLDTCLIIWGDGKNDSPDPSVWDDGNNINGDGCSSTCNVELGFKWSHTTTTPDVWTEIWGDGRRIGLGCDDGNTSNGDGCNSNCQTEPGFTWSGGSSTKRDIWTETWGDGKDFGTLDWDDGNTANGDGWSSTCEFETWYECKGGTPTNPDTWSKLQIGATIGKVGSDNSVDISFDHTMLNKSIGLNDLYVQIESSSSITFSWSATYTNSTLLHLSIGVSQVLQGTEILHVKFINNKVFRGPYGGWVRPDSLNATMPNSLASSVDTASSAGSPLKYITMIGILVAMGALLLLGGTLELIWSLVNTLQLLSYLPLMVPNYPQHVQLMFELLGFTNLDIQFISDFVKSILHLDELNAPSYDSRFMDNGIGNSLFLSNWASILFSLFFSLMTLIVWATLYSLLWWSKLKNKMSGVVSSYFFNNFLRFFSEGYLEIYFGALLNVMTYDFNSPVEIASFVVSWTFLFLLVIFPFMSAALIYDKRKQIREKNPVYLKRFGTMYQNFKLKGSWFSMQYYPIFLLRRLIFASFIIIAINYPEFQCNSFTFFSVVVRSS